MTFDFLSRTTRLDWGFGNPNKTAAFIAILMIAVWGLAYIHRRGFVVALTAFVALSIPLIMTLSRGGIVALGAGVSVLLYFAPRPWPIPRVIVTLLAGVFILIAATYLDTKGRLVTASFESDPSLANRWEIWKHVPRMMVDAPGGWGLGNSGEAYMQWYQPIDRTEGYRTLVSSHFTWLVEFGWLGRFWYFSFWIGVGLLCWPAVQKPWFAVLLSVWFTFAITAAFSSVAESALLWGIPGIFLLLAVVSHIRNQTWPQWSSCIGVAFCSTMALTGLFLIGQLDRRNTAFAECIQFSKGRLTVGDGTPKVWVIPGFDVFGRDYGKDIRRFLNGVTVNLEPIGFVSLTSNLPYGEEKTIVTGGTGRDLSHLKEHLQNESRLYLINPAFPPWELELPEAEKIQVFFGEFTQSPATLAWKKVAVSITEIRGTGDYCPSWANLIYRQKHE